VHERTLRRTSTHSLDAARELRATEGLPAAPFLPPISARRYDASEACVSQAIHLPDLSLSPKGESKAATILLRSLAAHGVRAAFGIPGGAVGPIFDALADVPEITLVPTRHETTAVFAALGHTRATGKPALVLATSGPGVTNTVTGVAAAMLEEIPVIVIGGDVTTAWFGRGAFQDGSPSGIDVVSLMRSVTRWSTVVCGASMAAGAAERAWLTATGPRPGPVFLSVPYDVADATTSTTWFANPTVSESAPDARACRAATEWLRASKRPLLVLGAGARAASRQAVDLAEALTIPVAVTGHAKGAFPERHRLYLGLLGNGGHASVTDYVASGPDVVCIVGSRVGDFATSGWRLPLLGSVATIQVDRDPWLVGRNVPVNLAIVGDASGVLREMSTAAAGKPPPIRALGARQEVPWDRKTRAGLVKPQAAVKALAASFPDAIFCSDIGEHMAFAQHYLVVDDVEHFHCMSGLGSMGSGLGTAIGLQHARRDATVVALVGDGGFNMFASEVLTCVEKKIGVIIAIFNDGRWNMVEHGFRAVFRRKPEGLPELAANLAAVARGYGADAELIDDVAQLGPARLRGLARRDVPLVLDIRTDPNEAMSIDTRSWALSRLRAPSRAP
jgi:acetolactate synthase-1/2/3 large subunit